MHYPPLHYGVTDWAEGFAGTTSIGAEVIGPLDIVGVSDRESHVRRGQITSRPDPANLTIPEGTEFVVPVLHAKDDWNG